MASAFAYNADEGELSGSGAEISKITLNRRKSQEIWNIYLFGGSDEEIRRNWLDSPIFFTDLRDI